MDYQKTLQFVYQNDIILESLRSFLDAEIEKSRPMITDEDDEGLGQKYRAFVTAKGILHEAVDTLHSFNGVNHSSSNIKHI